MLLETCSGAVFHHQQLLFPLNSLWFPTVTLSFNSQSSTVQFGLHHHTPALPVLLGPSVLLLLPSELSYSEPLSVWCSNLAVLHSILLANVLELCKQEVCPRLSWLSIWKQDHFSQSSQLRCFGVCTCYASTSLQLFNTGLAWLLPMGLPTRAKWSQNFPRQQPLPSAKQWRWNIPGGQQPLEPFGQHHGARGGWVSGQGLKPVGRGKCKSVWWGERNAVSALEKGQSSGRHFPLQQYWLIFLKCSYLSL